MTVPSATVRFSVIVQQAGHPELFTPWQDPQTDRGFKRAMAEHRVMTVRQENVGTRKDFGLVGFFKEPNATYLVFPKSLATYEGKRVVGIKYDLLATTPPKGPLASVSAPRHRPQPAAAAQKKPPNRFRVVVRSTATLEIAKEVE